MVIDSAATSTLTCREVLISIEMIENPPPRNEKILAEQARYQRMMYEADPSVS